MSTLTPTVSCYGCTPLTSPRSVAGKQQRIITQHCHPATATAALRMQSQNEDAQVNLFIILA